MRHQAFHVRVKVFDAEDDCGELLLSGDYFLDVDAALALIPGAGAALRQWAERFLAEEAVRTEEMAKQAAYENAEHAQAMAEE